MGKHALSPKQSQDDKSAKSIKSACSALWAHHTQAACRTSQMQDIAPVGMPRVTARCKWRAPLIRAVKQCADHSDLTQPSQLTDPTVTQRETVDDARV
jgi:hypothetical protein